MSQQTGHPSADMLNAYAERALLPAERRGISLHLANCEECREIVFLASDARKESIHTYWSAAKRRWWVWAAVPTLAMIAAVFALLPASKQQPKQIAANKVTNLPASPSPTTDEVSTATTEKETTSRENVRRDNKAVHAGAQERADRNGGENTSRKLKEDEVRDLPQLAASMPAPPPRSSSVNAATADGAGYSSEKRKIESPQVADSIVRREATAPRLQAGAGGGMGPSQASAGKLSTQAQAGAAGGPAASQTSIGGPVKQAQAGVGGGVLPQGSLQSVDVVSQSEQAYRPAPMTAEVSRNSMIAAKAVARLRTLAGWRVSNEGRLEKSVDGTHWQRVSLPGGQAVVAVASIDGSDIWASSANGGVFHSADGGAKWSEVVVGNGEQKMAGVVQSFNFTDAKHGSVSSGSHERWTTEDGGVSWRRAE